jgi:hypothetical protein
MPPSSRADDAAESLVAALKAHVVTDAPIDYHADRAFDVDKKRCEKHAAMLTALYAISGVGNLYA